jgi:hypothetical protein
MFNGEKCGLCENLFMICQQWVAVISSISCLFSVTVSEQCVISRCSMIQSNIYYCITPLWNMDMLENDYKHSEICFTMKEFRADKPFTIW